MSFSISSCNCDWRTFRYAQRDYRRNPRRFRRGAAERSSRDSSVGICAVDRRRLEHFTRCAVGVRFVCTYGVHRSRRDPRPVPSFIGGVRRPPVDTAVAGGILVPLIALLLAACFGKFVLRLNNVVLCGALAGADTTTAAPSGAVQDAAKSNLVTLGYTITYAVGNISAHGVGHRDCCAFRYEVASIQGDAPRGTVTGVRARAPGSRDDRARPRERGRRQDDRGRDGQHGQDRRCAARRLVCRDAARRAHRRGRPPREVHRRPARLRPATDGAPAHDRPPDRPGAGSLGTAPLHPHPAHVSKTAGGCVSPTSGHFGRMRLLEADEVWDADGGVEPLSEAFTSEAFVSMLDGRRTPIKTFLLDQKRISGVGNIYACEALWEAGIRPNRPAKEIIEAGPPPASRRNPSTSSPLHRGAGYQCRRLRRRRRAQRRVSKPAVRLWAAGRTLQTMWKPIVRTVLGQRGTWWCRGCSKNKIVNERSTQPFLLPSRRKRRPRPI